MHNKHKIHVLFEEKAKSSPNKIAIRYSDDCLTYAELNAKSNKLSRVLMNSGIRHGDFVIVLSEKSTNTIIAIFAILKIGASYIPWSQDIQFNALNSVCTSSKAKLIITENISSNATSNIDLPKIFFEDFSVLLDQQDDSDLKQDDNGSHQNIAYAIYTSGTTGIPKGVLITHESLIHTYKSWEKIYELTPDDVHIQIANPSFDVFTGELVRALCSGGELVICPKSTVINIEKMLS